MIYLLVIGLVFLMIGAVYLLQNPRAKGQEWSTARAVFLGAGLLGSALIVAYGVSAMLGA